jgi:hypothetical protein
MRFTTKGRIRLLRPDGSLVSQHNAAEEAYESAVNDAQVTGGGKYTVKYPDREIDLPLTRTVLETPPTGFTAQVISSSRIDLTWTANPRAAGYRIYQGSALIQSTAATGASVTGLTASTLYSFQISTIGSDGQEGAKSTAVSATTLSVSIDNTPNQFTFADQTSVARSTVVTSAPVSVAGLGTGVSITYNASGGTIDKNGDGNFLSSQILTNGDTFRARVTSSAALNTAVSCVVTASPSGVSDTFTATTVAVDYVPAGIVSMGNRSMAEGNSGTTNMTFTVLLSSAQARDVSFDYLTENGSATSGSDYTAVSGSKTIPAGSTSTTIDVPIIGDTNAESDETFTLRLRNIRYL